MLKPSSIRSLLRNLTETIELGYVTKWVGFASLIGILAGLAAVAFEWLIHVVSDFALRNPAGLEGAGVTSLDDRAWLLVAVPTLGGLITGWLIATFAPEAEGHGTDSVIKAFHQLKGVVRKRIILLKPITSTITIGTGGSAGQEGPVAQLGAGIGSALAGAFRLSDRDRRTFLLSGATAGVGAMFCSPLGGALLLPEVLYRKPEFEGEAIIPCIISSILAYTTFTTITGKQRAIEIDPEVLSQLAFDHPQQLLVYLVLAILCTLVGWFYTRTFYGLHHLTNRLKSIPRALRPALGGLLLGLLALAVAAVAGPNGVFFGGYSLIQSSIEGSLTLQVLLILMVAKILATSFTISSGGSGGVFAPSLAIGALLGAAVGKLTLAFFPDIGIHPAAFALVGMGGFFAGVSKTPVASVVMVCEMTGGYGLLAPLLLVSVVHMMLSTRWSMYEAQVPGMIDSRAHTGEFVVDVLEELCVRDVIEEARVPHLIRADSTLREVLREVSDSRESYFPVIDDDEQMVGIFSLTDLRRIFLEGVVEDLVIVRDFMIERVVTATMTDSLHDVLGRMTSSHINAIPVMDAEDPNHVICMLRRNDIGRGYDRKLRELKHGEPAEAE